MSNKFPKDIQQKALQKLILLDSAKEVRDLVFPASNRLHKLYKDREGQYSISINMQWRICFRWENGDAYDVDIVDYH